MLVIFSVGAALIVATVVIHAVGSTMWIHWAASRWASTDGQWKPGKSLPAVTWTALTLLLLHLIEAGVSALAYMLLVPEEQIRSFEQSYYFSLSTFTTVGYGDVTLDEGWRLLSGIEAMNGFLLVGWTTALLFMVVQRSAHASSPWRDDD